MTSPIFAIVGFAVFVGLWAFKIDKVPRPERGVTDRIVISAPVQLLLAGGDRFLAADFEAIRLAATGDASLTANTDDAAFRVRAHRVVAQLNACHEDNYYVGNALLSWGGAPDEGSDLLKRAMDCRTWDEYVPFFYGFNELFFHRNPAEARRAFEIAADRSVTNSATFRRMAIMIAADGLDDERLALDYLEKERDGASDPRLREMLDKRVQRLQGLLILRDAQHRYEAQFGHPLTDPAALISSGVLGRYPEDPLAIGYAFDNGKFILHKLRIAGLERSQ